jgi:hypothetical protein
MSNQWRKILLFLFLYSSTNILFAATYYSNSLASNPNDRFNWFQNSNNTGSNPANFTTAGDIFIIQAGHTYATTAAWNVTGTVQVAGTLTIGTANSITNLTIVNGGLVTGNAQSTIAGTFTIQDGGKYILNHSTPGNGTTTFLGTEAFSSNSTFEYQNLSAGGFVDNVTYGNLIYNFAGTRTFPATITINGNFEMKQGTLDFNGARTIGGNYLQTGGDVTLEGSTINGNFTINGSSAVCRITQSTTTSVAVQVGGNFEILAGRFDINDGPQNVTGYASSLDVNGNFTIDGGTFYFPTSSTTAVAGRLFVAKDVKFLSGGIAGFLSNPSSGTLTAGVYFDGTGEQSFYNAFTLATGSTKDAFYYKSPGGPSAINEYYIGSSGAQTTVNGSFGTPVGGHLRWPPSGSTIIKDFVINNTSSAPNNTVTLRDSRTINDTLFRTEGRLLLSGAATISYASGATLEYNGSTSITSESSEFPSTNGPTNLNINNPGSVTLHESRSLSGKLIFSKDNGLLNTSSCNATTSGTIITLNNGASVENAGNSRFVNGIVKKIGNTAFTFPIGEKQGSVLKYAPAQISTPTNATDEYSACYVGSNPGSASPSPGYDPTSRDNTLYDLSATPPINYKVSTCEYWHFNKGGTSTDVKLTLSWAYGRSCAFNSTDSLIVTNWLTSTTPDQWTNLYNDNNNSPGPGPTQTFGWVTSKDPITNYGTFTLAHPKTRLATLNNSAISLRGSRVKDKDQLDWALSAACANAIVYVEQSTDGTHFKPSYQFPVYDIATCKKNMEFAIDANQKNITSYYRIKAIQPVGNVLYSNIIALRTMLASSLQIFPNPVIDQLRLKGITQAVKELSIFNQMGQTLYLERGISINTLELPVSGWNKGIYYLRMIYENGQSENLRFIKQ